MNCNRGIPALAFLLAGFAHGAPPPPAPGDVTHGARVFAACTPCHSVVPGRHMTGPSLAHAWGRKAGTAPGFVRYSDAMKRAGWQWNDETLERWLTDPQRMLPGTTMSFAGLRNEGDRRDVIAYVKAISEGKTDAKAPSGGGMMMGGAKIDLKKAPPAGQVTSIVHCKDTYTVTTADGRVEKVWEFNLRLKTDSSDLGPREGHPVAIGAGMQGDRASIVFAHPAEISPFIGAECRTP